MLTVLLVYEVPAFSWWDSVPGSYARDMAPTFEVDVKDVLFAGDATLIPSDTGNVRTDKGPPYVGTPVC